MNNNNNYYYIVVVVVVIVINNSSILIIVIINIRITTTKTFMKAAPIVMKNYFPFDDLEFAVAINSTVGDLIRITTINTSDDLDINTKSEEILLL